MISSNMSIFEKCLVILNFKFSQVHSLFIALPVVSHNLAVTHTPSVDGGLFWLLVFFLFGIRVFK